MHHLDVVRGASLRHKETGGHVDVLQVERDEVRLDWWDSGRQEWLALNRVLEEFETLVQPDGFPVLAVEPGVVDAESVEQSVRIFVVEPHPAFVDDNEPLTLQANHLGMPVLKAYLAAVAAGDAWLDRESGGNASLNESPLTLQPGWTVMLSRETYSKRYPSYWFSVMIGTNEDDGTLLNVTLRDKALATAIFEAIASGDLVLSRS